MKKNLLFILADQLRAASLPAYGERQIATPHLDRLASEGVTFTNAIATCPVCTPYRSMMLTGRHPQTTGHLINFVRTRHDEIGWGDVFSHAAYKTGWIGKWHLHTGSFPHVPHGPDFVPEGRDRLGFDFWRGYNFHCKYFDGFVNKGDWRNERWDGYETDAMARYTAEFLDTAGKDPFCLFVSPHQPHSTPYEFAPEKYYQLLPEELILPDNVPEGRLADCLPFYRHYLAMTLAVDDMVGQILAILEARGLRENTLVIFTSDHGSQFGSQGIDPWAKKMPYRESLWVPLIMSLPGVFDGGIRRDTVICPVDYLPSCCSLFGIPVPRTVEGHDLSGALTGKTGAFEQELVLTMNFTASHDYLKDGEEWRGVIGKRYSYARWIDGKTELFDIQADPLEKNNLSGNPEHADLEKKMEKALRRLMDLRGDELVPCTTHAHWFDSQRRVRHNAFGPMGDPEEPPDWSLMR
jgi:arylsulfatase A-like enzyme